jgi:hypothetical protein
MYQFANGHRQRGNRQDRGPDRDEIDGFQEVITGAKINF